MQNQLAAVRRYKAQKVLNAEREEAVRRNLRWVKLKRVLDAAKFGRKVDL